MPKLTTMTVSVTEETRERLEQIALALGYEDPRHGGGSVSALVRAIADGEVQVTREQPQEQVGQGPSAEDVNKALDQIAREFGGQVLRREVERGNK